jgi:hypothetical protein
VEAYIFRRKIEAVVLPRHWQRFTALHGVKSQKASDLYPFCNVSGKV